MFTGIVEAVGHVAAVTATASGHRVRIRTPLGRELSVGDSLAVDGVCLTVVDVGIDLVQADLGPETLRVTTLGALREGQGVNLERPLRADGRFGGHVVLGHVDALGVVEEVRHESSSHWLTIGFPPAIAAYFIRKGSVAVDGVSLTVAELRARSFDVQIVPHTWAVTTLGTLGRQDPVNIECDMLGKHIVRALELAELGPVVADRRRSAVDTR
jgi:riboflavin synthase